MPLSGISSDDRPTMISKSPNPLASGAVGLSTTRKENVEPLHHLSPTCYTCEVYLPFQQKFCTLLSRPKHLELAGALLTGKTRGCNTVQRQDIILIATIAVFSPYS